MQWGSFGAKKRAGLEPTHAPQVRYRRKALQYLVVPRQARTVRPSRSEWSSSRMQAAASAARWKVTKALPVT